MVRVAASWGLFARSHGNYSGRVVTSSRRSSLGLAGVGLLLGVALGWLAGLLRAPRPGGSPR